MRMRSWSAVGLALFVACKGPGSGADSPNGAESRGSIDRGSPIPIEVKVTAGDEVLRQAVDSMIRLNLQLMPGVKVATDAGVWRIEITTTAVSKMDSAANATVTMSLRVVDGGLGHHEMTDGNGHQVDSILGGTLTCRLEDLSSACANIVADVNKFAQEDGGGGPRGR
jgi:hypothetical protein